MFIEQVYSKNFDLVKYLPVPLVFLLLILVNYAATFILPMDVDDLIQQEIARNEANFVLFRTLLPLVIFFIILLVWVKFVHKQSIRSLTTARPKVDWGRIFFAFGIWGGQSPWHLLQQHILLNQKITYSTLSRFLLPYWQR